MRRKQGRNVVRQLFGVCTRTVAGVTNIDAAQTGARADKTTAEGEGVNRLDRNARSILVWDDQDTAALHKVLKVVHMLSHKHIFATAQVLWKTEGHAPCDQDLQSLQACILGRNFEEPANASNVAIMPAAPKHEIEFVRCPEFLGQPIGGNDLEP